MVNASLRAPNSNQLLRSILLLGLLGLFIFVFFPVWKTLIAAWSHSEEYSHGFLVAPLSLYLVLRKRKTLGRIRVSSSPSGLVLVLAGLLLYLFAHTAEILTLAAVSLLIVLAGALLFLVGVPMFRELLFPFFFLLFMIPVPSQIYASFTIPLQLLVSKSSAWLASLSGVPIYREGNVIHLPGHTLQVVEACSGLRSMLSLLTLSALYGYLTLRSRALRVLLFLFSVPAAVLINVVRVLLTAVFLSYLGMDLTTGAIHTYFGVAIFVMSLLVIAGAKGVLAKWDTSRTARS